MTDKLNRLGIRVGQRRVGRLMRQNGIQVIRSRKFKRTTDSDHTFNFAPNLLQQDFTASGANQKWAGDMAYVWTRESWVYLAVIIDLLSPRVAGWDRAQHPKPCKLTGSAYLCRAILAKLTRKWSPQQVAGWLMRKHPDDALMRVSPEPI